MCQQKRLERVDGLRVVRGTDRKSKTRKRAATRPRITPPEENISVPRNRPKTKEKQQKRQRRLATESNKVTE